MHKQSYHFLFRYFTLSQLAVIPLMARCCAVIIAVFILCSATGCETLNKLLGGRIFTKSHTLKPPNVLPTEATLNDIMTFVNNNNGRKRSFVTTNARISIDGVPVALNSQIVYEYPKKYRAIGVVMALSGNDFDIGSNERLFWVWYKQDPQNAIYYCSRDQYETSSVRENIPIDPNWLIEAMGIAIFQPNEEHQLMGRTPEGHWKITTKRPTPTGTFIKNTIVDSNTACVLAQELYNPVGRFVASAESPNHTVDAVTGITYPQTVNMRFYLAGNQQFGMRLTMGQVQFNQSSAFVADTFTMPNLGSQAIDLGKISVQQPIVQQVSGAVQSMPVTGQTL
ncbi:MAG: hypothetical protein LBT05_02440 [Planctomycetaceae bacterium]|jgi:hypothetical protein|nr:hypothetical protein [Planctomycetaceae bacterium]